MLVYRKQIMKFRSISRLLSTNKTITGSGGTIAATVTHQNDVKSYREVPGPLNLPFIGPMHNFLPGGKLAGYKGIELAERLYKLYGPIVKLGGIFGGYDTVFLFDPKAVEYVLRSEEPTPTRPSMESLEYYRKRYKKTYDPKRVVGLIDQGEGWREFRTKVNPIMMHPKTIQLYADVLNDVANDMVPRLRSIRDQDDRITTRINVEMNLWALESIAAVALGARLNCFDPNLQPHSPVSKLIQNVHDIFYVVEKLDYTPNFWRLCSTPNFRKAMNIYEEHERLTKYFIDQAMKKLEESKKRYDNADSDKPIIEKLLEIDVETARVMASDMLLAGIDTAANTVLATLYLLAKNPAKQKKLREELSTDRTRRPYLKACIKESRRMLPVANGNVRLLSKEYNLLGYRIPKNVVALFAHQYMSSMSEYYRQADEFIPERWTADKEDHLYPGNTHHFVTATFGYGVRTCIGRRIAQLEMETIITKIIENFQIDWPSSEPLHINPSSLNYITEPFHFVFKDL